MLTTRFFYYFYSSEFFSKLLFLDDKLKFQEICSAFFYSTFITQVPKKYLQFFSFFFLVVFYEKYLLATAIYYIMFFVFICFHEGVTSSISCGNITNRNLFSGVALISETYVCYAHTQVYFF